uniref:Uncharacterized protein n=1 Tax=Faecalibaculum rodentium TaxID=1702221 RepID=A0A140DV13_9FIRM|nr:hypothetical protein AALO17_13560 [Faecalibaculum rodentium]
MTESGPGIRLLYFIEKSRRSAAAFPDAEEFLSDHPFNSQSSDRVRKETEHGVSGIHSPKR